MLYCNLSPTRASATGTLNRLQWLASQRSLFPIFLVLLMIVGNAVQCTKSDSIDGLASGLLSREAHHQVQIPNGHRYAPIKQYSKKYTQLFDLNDKNKKTEASRYSDFLETGLGVDQTGSQHTLYNSLQKSTKQLMQNLSFCKSQRRQPLFSAIRSSRSLLATLEPQAECGGAICTLDDTRKHIPNQIIVAESYKVLYVWNVNKLLDEYTDKKGEAHRAELCSYLQLVQESQRIEKAWRSLECDCCELTVCNARAIGIDVTVKSRCPQCPISFSSIPFIPDTMFPGMNCASLGTPATREKLKSEIVQRFPDLVGTGQIEPADSCCGCMCCKCKNPVDSLGICVPCVSRKQCCNGFKRDITASKRCGPSEGEVYKAKEKVQCDVIKSDKKPPKKIKKKGGKKKNKKKTKKKTKKKSGKGKSTKTKTTFKGKTVSKKKPKKKKSG